MTPNEHEPEPLPEPPNHRLRDADHADGTEAERLRARKLHFWPPPEPEGGWALAPGKTLGHVPGLAEDEAMRLAKHRSPLRRIGLDDPDLDGYYPVVKRDPDQLSGR